jgi:hypothetical protein
MWLELGLLFLGLLRLQLLGADTAATGHRRAQPTSLAPGLDYPVSFQHEVPPAIGGPVLGEQTVYVDCDRGSDSAHGLSAAAALRTLPAAQRVARQARARRASWALSGSAATPNATVAVEVRGSCHLESPLVLTAADGGSSAGAPAIWRGAEPAMLVSGGKPIVEWTKVSWPGVPDGTVLRANVSDWPIPIKTLRVGEQWVARSRFPKADPTNYSAGWLTTAAWTPPPTKHHGPNPVTASMLGLEPAAVPPSLLEEMREASQAYVNVFGLGGEKDVLNQIVRASGITHNVNGSAIVAPLQAGVQPLQRFFLENVKSVLAEGEFFYNETEGALYVWPKREWLTASGSGRLVAIAPTTNHVIELRGTQFLTLSNLTIRDSSYTSEGCWCGAAGEPNDAAVIVDNSHHVTVEASSFLAGVGGYGVTATNGSLGLRVVGCRVEGVGQGGVLLYGTMLDHSQPDGAFISHNFVRDIGKILKHVGGVGLHSASHTVIAHNRISRSPRYGINIDQAMPSSASMHNLIEYNVVSAACMETADCGALEFNGDGTGAAYEAIEFNLNNTILYNNVTNTVGAGATDGVHVCQHGDNHDSGTPGLGCRNLTWCEKMPSGFHHFRRALWKLILCPILVQVREKCKEILMKRVFTGRFISMDPTPSPEMGRQAALGTVVRRFSGTCCPPQLEELSTQLVGMTTLRTTS